VSEGLSITLPAELLDAIVAETTRRVLAELDNRDSNNTTWPEYMNVDTAARYLDASPERLRKLVARREIPYHQEAPGCRVFLNRHDLDQWMNTLRREPQ
jgi:excisionase family DNA binding protein